MGALLLLVTVGLIFFAIFCVVFFLVWLVTGSAGSSADHGRKIPDGKSFHFDSSDYDYEDEDYEDECEDDELRSESLYRNRDDYNSYRLPDGYTDPYLLYEEDPDLYEELFDERPEDL